MKSADYIINIIKFFWQPPTAGAWAPVRHQPSASRSAPLLAPRMSASSLLHAAIIASTQDRENGLRVSPSFSGTRYMQQYSPTAARAFSSAASTALSSGLASTAYTKGPKFSLA